jgi:hypothetical protein
MHRPRKLDSSFEAGRNQNILIKSGADPSPINQTAHFFELQKSRGPLHQKLCLQQVEDLCNPKGLQVNKVFGTLFTTG